MEARQLGKSVVAVPPVIFGAWAVGGWFWGGTDDGLALDAIRASLDEGVTCIDTAPAYGFGHSEEIVGKAIRGRRHEVVVATKCGLRWDSTDGDFFFEDTFNGRQYRIHRNLRKASIVEECERSLRRLGIETIDLYQCHWPDKTTPLDETMGALVGLQRQGKIRAIGVSNFTVDMIRQCQLHGIVASDQPEYSLLKRDIEGDVLPFCRAQGVGVIAYKPILQGLLSGKVTMDRSFPEGDYRVRNPWFSPANRARVLAALDSLKPLAAAHSATLSQLVINWTAGEPGVTAAIVGARNPAQARENAAAVRFRLKDDERALVRGTFEKLGTPQ